jgi:DNA-binding NarL/FixJ family response regulator
MNTSRPDCSIYVWARHPLAKYALQEALSSKRLPVTCCEADSIPAFAANNMLNVLIVDTCSVIGWRDSAAQWHERGGRVIILVPEDWCGKGIELQVLAVGIWGIISMSRDFARELSEAVCSILDGRVWIKRNAADGSKKEIGVPMKTDRSSMFTRREEQILEPLLNGVPNKMIAVKLRLSERTVKYHVSHILRKLNVASRKELFVGCGLQYLTFSGFSGNWKVDRGGAAA